MPRLRILLVVQNKELLPVAKQRFTPLKFIPEEDGLTFNVEGALLSEMPKELIGGGTPLGHATGPTYRIISGPAVQVGERAFRIQFDRGRNGWRYLVTGRASRE